MKSETFGSAEGENYFIDQYISKFKEGPEVWSRTSQEINEALNIVPEYLQSGSEAFIKNREMLNTRPGMAIANHPSTLDIFFILPAIARSDVLVMTQKKRFDFLKDAFGEKHVVPAATDAKELEGIINLATSHISKGGLFVFFPSGGEEMKTNELEFKGGFRGILRNVSPDSMVYSFYIDPKAGKKIMSEMIGPPKGGDDKPFLMAPELHVRPSADRLEVKVNEYFSEAREWQEIMNRSGNFSSRQRNAAATKHFLEKAAI